MVSHKDCMVLILATVPEFRADWEKYLRYWGDDKPGLSNDIGEFSSFVIDNFNFLSSDKQESTFLLVETFLREGDDILKDAIATSFLENLINAVSAERIEAGLFVKFLGDESRNFCKAWDEFTGIKTSGL
jgi:hypothetical protein